VELDADQEDMSMEYAEGGTMGLNVVKWIDEASKPPLQFAIPR